MLRVMIFQQFGRRGCFGVWHYTLLSPYGHIQHETITLTSLPQEREEHDPAAHFDGYHITLILTSVVPEYSAFVRRPCRTRFLPPRQSVQVASLPVHSILYDHCYVISCPASTSFYVYCYSLRPHFLPSSPRFLSYLYMATAPFLYFYVRVPRSLPSNWCMA